MDESKKTEAKCAPAAALGRRDLMKLGAGAVVTALHAPKLMAQGRGGGAGGAAPAEPMAPVRTRTGYVNNANRLGGNGPMDDATRKIVSWVHGFSGTNMKPNEVEAINRIMLDQMAATVAGFEEEVVRICVGMAADAQPVKLKSTVFGYGISTTPELATFANSAMCRMTDFNDTGGARGNSQAGHPADLIAAALAMGEALHSTGAEVLDAVTVAYELRSVPAGGEPVGAAMAAGKLMKLNEDQLANALTLALTPHQALNKGVGAMSMWKGVRSAEAMKCGIWGALLARAGMTGPPQPFEGKGGLYSQSGRPRDYTLPDNPTGELAIVRVGFKRYPAEASSQAVLDLVPEMRAWTKVDEIEWIHHEMPFGVWEEIADAPKWDPRNRETADHSMPFILARALIDGEIYLDSFTEEKYRDPVALALLAKISCSPVAGWAGNSPARTTIRKKNGEQRSWDAQGGRRGAPSGELLSTPTPDHRLTLQEIGDKFNRACDHMKVDKAQRDRARGLWSNLRAVRDIGEAIQSLAKFGQPKPL